MSCGSYFRNTAGKIKNRKPHKCQVALGEVSPGWKSPHPTSPIQSGMPALPPKEVRGKPRRRFSSLLVWVRRWTPPARGSSRPSESLCVLGDELFTVPSPEHEGPHGGGDPVLLPLRGREGAGGGDSACSPPLWPLLGATPPGQLVPAEAPRPEPRSPAEPGSPLAWGLGRGRGRAAPSSTQTRWTKCSGRWWWSLASTGRMSCRSSGSVTTNSTTRRTCRPATEPEAWLG